MHEKKRHVSVIRNLENVKSGFLLQKDFQLKLPVWRRMSTNKIQLRNLKQKRINH